MAAVNGFSAFGYHIIMSEDPGFRSVQYRTNKRHLRSYIPLLSTIDSIRNLLRIKNFGPSVPKSFKNALIARNIVSLTPFGIFLLLPDAIVTVGRLIAHPFQGKKPNTQPISS